MPKKRIGLLLDRPSVGNNGLELIKWIKEQPDLELAALIIHPAPQSAVSGIRKFLYLARTQGAYAAISRAAFAAMVRLERAVTMRTPFYRAHFTTHDVSGAAPLITVHPRVSASGFVYRFEDADIDRIRALELDLLVRAGNGILKGDILRVARHGIISFHHADNRVNRGGPAGFWEVYHRQPESGFVIQRLTEELDGGEVLFRGSVRTDLTFCRNQANLIERSAPYLALTIRNVLDGKCRAEPPHIYTGQLYRTPLLHHSARYLAGVVRTVGEKLLRRLIGRKWHWGVAWLWSDWRGAVLWRAKTIPNPKGCFLADPFAFEHEGGHYVFAEEFRYREGRGVISAYRVTKAGPERIGVVLDTGHHLSFPFLFRHDGEIYMAPESEGEGKATLYRCAAFPDRWEPVTTLADGEVADTMIFERDGKWWMLHTRRAAPVCGNVADLHLFYADSPMGEWKPHPLNPVVMDAARGRNGGLLHDEDGNLYRVAQRHRFAQYGEGVGIYRITELSETSYREELVQRLDAGFGKKLKGLHHLHHAGGLTVFDFLKDERPRPRH